MVFLGSLYVRYQREFGPWWKVVWEVARHSSETGVECCGLNIAPPKRLFFEGRYNIISLNDWHVPFHDHRAIMSAFDFCRTIQPQVIVLHELHDFYAISKFDKNPARRQTMQDEIDLVNRYIAELRATCPDSRMILIESNHLDRLRRYLWRFAPALASLRTLEIPKLLELEANGIEYMECFIHQRFLWKHGDLVSKESGMTARRELAKEGMSGSSGHTHRLGKHYRRNRGGSYVWMEGGCLCDLNPEYIKGTADWQQGFTLVSFEGPTKKTFFATDLPIINYEVPL